MDLALFLYAETVQDAMKYFAESKEEYFAFGNAQCVHELSQSVRFPSVTA